MAKEGLGERVGIGKSEFFFGGCALMLPPSGSSWVFGGLTCGMLSSLERNGHIWPHPKLQSLLYTCLLVNLSHKFQTLWVRPSFPGSDLNVCTTSMPASVSVSFKRSLLPQPPEEEWTRMPLIFTFPIATWHRFLFRSRYVSSTQATGFLGPSTRRAEKLKERKNPASNTYMIEYWFDTTHRS